LGVAAIDPSTSDTAAAGDPAGSGSTSGVAAGLPVAGEITPTNSESHDQNNGSGGSNQKTMHVSSLSLQAVISRSPNVGNGGADRTTDRSSGARLQWLNSPPFSLSLFHAIQLKSSRRRKGKPCPMMGAAVDVALGLND
jgi:hypothetical protein